MREHCSIVLKARELSCPFNPEYQCPFMRIDVQTCLPNTAANNVSVVVKTLVVNGACIMYDEMQLKQYFKWCAWTARVLKKKYI